VRRSPRLQQRDARLHATRSVASKPKGLCSLVPDGRRGALLGAASAQARANGDNLGQESDRSDRHDDRALVPIEHGPGYSLCPTRKRQGPLLPENASDRPSLGLPAQHGLRYATATRRRAAPPINARPISLDQSSCELTIPTANQVRFAALRISNMGLAQGVGGTGESTPWISKSPLGGSSTPGRDVRLGVKGAVG
jgi:hypothetical protein